ncbi:hypothetical protein [Jannaschia formosa]|uniref:hypothetical protein n=1 Tax=Jannaschia formosa TaxID=2259592 RepID=UPI000E1C1DE2|nr:hypothetical protein [Jannaschia formosa]TFL16456.1 hypothetical protein DR046_20255 [Jannaschia formosa]
MPLVWRLDPKQPAGWYRLYDGDLSIASAWCVSGGPSRGTWQWACHWIGGVVVVRSGGAETREQAMAAVRERVLAEHDNGTEPRDLMPPGYRRGREG